MEEKTKKKMKTWKKVVLICLAVFLVATIALVIWQWNNIKAFYYFATIENKEEIVRKIDEQKKNREEIVSQYINGTVRDFTEEEEKKISEGTLTVEEATEIIREDFKTSVKDKPAANSGISANKKKEIEF